MEYELFPYGSSLGKLIKPFLAAHPLSATACHSTRETYLEPLFQGICKKAIYMDQMKENISDFYENLMRKGKEMTISDICNNIFPKNCIIFATIIIRSLYKSAISIYTPLRHEMYLQPLISYPGINQYFILIINYIQIKRFNSLLR